MQEFSVALAFFMPLIGFFVAIKAYLKWVGNDMGAVVRYGGAVLAGAIAIAASFGVLLIVQPLMEPVPESLNAAGIPDRAGWSSDQANIAARVTRSALERTYERVDRADETGDAALIPQIYDEMLPLITGWNMQGDSPAAAPHRACSLAIAHLMDGVAHITNGQRWVIRDRYKNTVKDCG